MPPDRDQARALEMILKKGIVRGRDLRHKLDIDYGKLVGTVDVLVKRDLIDVEGQYQDARGIAKAVFSFRPSARRKVHDFLQE